MKTLLYRDKKPPGYANWMNPIDVAHKIVENLKKDQQETEQVIRRPAV